MYYIFNTTYVFLTFSFLSLLPPSNSACSSLCSALFSHEKAIYFIRHIVMCTFGALSRYWKYTGLVWHISMYPASCRYSLFLSSFSSFRLLCVSFPSFLTKRVDTFCPNTPITMGKQIQLIMDGYDNTTDVSTIHAVVNGHKYLLIFYLFACLG